MRNRESAMRQITIATALLVAATAVGCTHTIDLPSNFVAVEKDALGDYVARGVSADGVVVALRSENNPKNGTLEFWQRAIKNELVVSKGYKLEKEEAVTDRAGTAGTLLLCTAQRSGTDFTYLLAVYVTSEAVLIAEAGGKTEAVTPRLEDLKTAIRSVR
jgi:hypothetical protein